MIAGDVIADDGVVAALVLHRSGGDGDGASLHAVGLGGDGKLTGLVGGLHDGHQLASGSVAGQALIRGVVDLTAVVHAHDGALALDGELDVHVVGVDQVAVGILNIDGDVAQVVAVGHDGVAVSGEGELRGTRGALHHAAALGLGDLVAVFVKGLDFQSTSGIGHHEGGIQALIARLLGVSVSTLGKGAVGVTSVGGGHGGGGSAHFLTVEVDLHHGSVGVHNHFHLVVAVLGHIVLVPGGQHMEGGHIVVPLALIQIVAILGQAVGVDDAEVRGLGRGPAAHSASAGAVPGGGLADVVKASPHKLAHGGVQLEHTPPGIGRHGAPAHGALVVGGQQAVAAHIHTVALAVIHATAGDGRGRLRVVHLPALAHTSLQVGSGGVVVADDAAILGHHSGHLVGDVPVLLELVVAKRGRTGGVNLFDPVNEVLGDGGIVAVASIGHALEDLVAQRVHDDSGGVLVLVGHGLDVKLGPGHASLAAQDVVALGDGCVEPLGVVLGVAVLGQSPGVEGLVDEHDALAVGDLHQLRSGGVMGDADGVAAHLLEDLHLTLDGPVPGLGAQSALVVVHTHALETGGLAVELKTSGGVELGPAEAELGGIGVHHLLVHQHLSDGGVQVGVVSVPQLGAVHLGGEGHVLGGTSVHGDGLAGDRSHRLLAAQLVDALTHHHVGGLTALVGHGGDHVHGAVGAVGLSQLGGGDVSTVAVHVHGIGDGQVHGAVDTAAGIPTAGGSLVLHLHGQHVVALIVQVLLGQLEGKRGIAIGVEAQLMAIEVHGGVHVHAAEIDRYDLVLPLRGDGEGLAVPAGAAQQVAALGLAALAVLLLDAVVVGQIHVPPSGVVVVGVCVAAAQVEPPVVIEVHSAAVPAVGVDVDRLLRRGSLCAGRATLATGECANRYQVRAHHQGQSACQQPFLLEHDIPPSFHSR